MLKLIRFEVKKLLNIKTLICFVLLFCTFLGFFIYNSILDSKYEGEVEIKRYKAELEPYEGDTLLLQMEEDRLAKTILQNKGIDNENSEYDVEYNKALKEVFESEWGKENGPYLNFYERYMSCLNIQISVARSGIMEQQIRAEVNKNQIILDEVENGLIQGKLIPDENNNIICENINETKRKLKYNQLLLDKEVEFLHSPYEMTGYNFIDKVIKNFIPFLLPILVVIICIDNFTKENDTGSIKFLLLQPHSRRKVFMAKLIACITTVVLTLILSIGIVFVIAIIMNGIGCSNYPIEINSCTLKSLVQDKSIQYELTTISNLRYTILLITFTLLYSIFLLCLCVVISILSDSTMNAFVLGVSIILLSYLFNTVQITKVWIRFIPILNANFQNILCKYNGLTSLTSMILLIAYSVLLYVVSLCIFNKKDVVC